MSAPLCSALNSHFLYNDRAGHTKGGDGLNADRLNTDTAEVLKVFRWLGTNLLEPWFVLAPLCLAGAFWLGRRIFGRRAGSHLLGLCTLELLRSHSTK